jgi:hypothetical protein
LAGSCAGSCDPAALVPYGGASGGDRAAYVTAVYEAGIVSGVPTTADDELSDVAWFSRSELGHLISSRLSQALLKATGHL